MLTSIQNTVISSAISLVKHFLIFKESNLATLSSEFTSVFSFHSESYLFLTFFILFQLFILTVFFLEIFSIQKVFFLPLLAYCVFIELLYLLMLVHLDLSHQSLTISVCLCTYFQSFEVSVILKN